MSPSVIPHSIFLDTNVFLDFLLRREGEQAAGVLLRLGQDGMLRICLSSLTVANLSYVLRKEKTPAQLNELFRLFLRHYVILPVGSMDVYHTVKGEYPDVEDALQLSCSRGENCEALITRNKVHFEPYSDIPVYTAEEFLRKLGYEHLTHF